MPSSLHAALWIERFQLQAVLRAHAPVTRGTVIGLLDAEPAETARDAKVRLLHASHAAQRHGVHAGMTASQAQARCPRILFLHRDANEENRAQQDLLDCAALWTPDYEATAPGMCVLDLSRARDIAGRKEECGRRMHEHLAERRLHARVGFAGNAGLALLAAHAGDPVLVLRENTDDAEQFLARLPVEALRPAPDVAEALRLWGIRTLGQFAKLPRQGVATRLGAEGLLLHDLARGGSDRLLRLVRPPVEYREEVELEHGIESLEPLLFLLRRALDKLCAELSGAWLVAAALRLTLRFADQSEHHRELRAAEPTRDADLLLRMLQTHLDGFTAAAPAIAFALQLQPAPPAASQGQLFERGLRDPNRFAETLAQLEALLGAGRAGRVRLLPSRKPESFTVGNFLDAASRNLLVHSHDRLPLRLLRPAPPAGVFISGGRPVAVQANGTVFHVAGADGPWLLSGDWWDADAWTREVWELTDDHGLHRIARHNGAWRLDAVIG
jgi:protein ImuB